MIKVDENGFQNRKTNKLPQNSNGFLNFEWRQQIRLDDNWFQNFRQRSTKIGRQSFAKLGCRSSSRRLKCRWQYAGGLRPGSTQVCNAVPLKLADSVDTEFESNLGNKFARVYLSNRSLCTRVMYRTSELGRASSRVATSCWGIPRSAT